MVAAALIEILSTPKSQVPNSNDPSMNALSFLTSITADMDLMATWYYFYGTYQVRKFDLNNEVSASYLHAQLFFALLATLSWLVFVTNGHFLLRTLVRECGIRYFMTTRSHLLWSGIVCESLPQIVLSLLIDHATFGPGVRNAGTVNVMTSVYNAFVKGFASYDVRRSTAEAGVHSRSYEGHAGEVCAVATLDGEFFASGAEDATCRVWHVDSGECMRTLEGHAGPICAVTVVPGTTDRLLTASIDATAKLWDVNTGQCLRTFVGHDLCIWAIACVTDRLYFLSGSSDKTVKEWELSTGTCVHTYHGHSEPVLSIASLDKYTFLTSSKDMTVKMWHRGSKKKIRTFVGHTNWVWVVAVLDETQFVSGSEDETIKLWHVENGKCLRIFAGHAGPVNSLVKVDRNHFLSGSDDRTTRLWSAQYGTCLKSFYGHTGVVWGLTMVDHNHFLSASSDHSVKFWALDVESERHDTMIGGDLSIDIDRQNSKSQSQKFMAVSSYDNGDSTNVWDLDESEVDLENGQGVHD